MFSILFVEFLNLLTLSIKDLFKHKYYLTNTNALVALSRINSQFHFLLAAHQHIVSRGYKAYIILLAIWNV